MVVPHGQVEHVDRVAALLAVAVLAGHLGDAARGLDQLALDDRTVRADDAPGHDVRVGAGLVDQPGDERAVPRQGVDAAVEGSTWSNHFSGSVVVDVADRSPPSGRRSARLRRSQGCSPQPVSSVATTGRRPGLVVGTAAGRGPTYATGCRPPQPRAP